MKWLKIGGGLVIVIVIGVLVVSGVLPRDYRVERSIDIAALPARVYEQVSSLKKWEAWSPWVARDASIETTYSGPEEGVGAKAVWTSDGSGEGSQTIVVAEPDTRLEIALDFGNQGSAKAYWRFEPAGEGTHVTWGMSGEMPGLLGGLLAAQMNGWIGADYEDGLARLKQHVEGLPPPEAVEKGAASADAGTVDGGAPR